MKENDDELMCEEFTRDGELLLAVSEGRRFRPVWRGERGVERGKWMPTRWEAVQAIAQAFGRMRGPIPADAWIEDGFPVEWEGA